MSSSIHYRLREEQDALYLCLEGDLDEKSFMAVSNALGGHRLDRPVKVDLAGVGYADSTGLRALVLLQRQVRDAGAEFTLIAPSEPVRRIFRSTGLSQVFHVDEEDSHPSCFPEDGGEEGSEVGK